MKKILFIVQYPKEISPSQRFRIELYENILSSNGFIFHTSYFIDNKTKKVIYRKGHLFSKIIGVIKGFFKRIWDLFGIYNYEYIFIQREASPVGPPIFEWIYSKLLRKKIIYDFDDALWQPASSENNIAVKFIKCFWKIRFICKWAHKVSVGNNYLLDFAKQYNNNVVLNPTCVDTDNTHNTLINQATEEVNIGWTGSFTNLIYLDDIILVLQKLEIKYSFSFTVIADKDPKLPLRGYKFIPWKKETEIRELMECNIGIMPLNDTVFAKGKCGFKLIQFLSLGIPCIASPIGENINIIDEGLNGFLCSTNEEWYNAFEKLICDTELRKKMGKLGRNKIESNYSLNSNKANFISLFQ